MRFPPYRSADVNDPSLQSAVGRFLAPVESRAEGRVTVTGRLSEPILGPGVGSGRSGGLIGIGTRNGDPLEGRQAEEVTPSEWAMPFEVRFDRIQVILEKGAGHRQRLSGWTLIATTRPAAPVGAVLLPTSR